QDRGRRQHLLDILLSWGLLAVWVPPQTSMSSIDRQRSIRAPLLPDKLRPLTKWLKGRARAQTKDASVALPYTETDSLTWFQVWALPMTSWESCLIREVAVEGTEQKLHICLLRERMP
ncbi:hypothetical protein STEG23_015224, partial [Scotinomys teguina]